MEGNEGYFSHLFLYLLYLTQISVPVFGKMKLATTNDIHRVVDNSLFFQILQPESLSYTYKVKPSRDFGAPFLTVYGAIDLLIADPYDACSPLSNTVSGSVIMVSRGSCSFLSKSFYAEKAGAVAVIIADNKREHDDAMIDMIKDDTQRNVNIPSLYLSGKDGAMIKKELERQRLDKAIITIPYNITGILPHQAHRTPWTLW